MHGWKKRFSISIHVLWATRFPGMASRVIFVCIVRRPEKWNTEPNQSAQKRQKKPPHRCFNRSWYHIDMAGLQNKKCVPCRVGAAPLEIEKINGYLHQLRGRWE